MTDAAAVPAAESAPPLSESTRPPRGRARARVLFLVGAVGLLLLPWLGGETGFDVVGAPAAAALLAAWGVAATTLLARTRRGLVLGAAAVDAALATLATALVVLRHPWLPGADLRPTWVPIFGPLALLALMDLGTRLAKPVGGGDVTVIRAFAAAVAAGAFAVAWQPLPMAIALWLAASPAAVHLPASARGTRRALEAGALAAAALLLAAPDLNAILVSRASSGESPTGWMFAFRMLFVLPAAAISLWGVFEPEGRVAHGA